MERGSSLIMLWIIILVILPFAINAIIKKMKIMKLQNGFRKRAQDLNLSDHEIIHRKYAIGIDKEAKKLAYLESNNESSWAVINLAEISNCKVKISDRARSNVTNLIELTFSPRDSTKPEMKLEVYNNHAFMPTSDDIAAAEKWAGIANSSLA